MPKEVSSIQCDDYPPSCLLFVPHKPTCYIHTQVLDVQSRAVNLFEILYWTFLLPGILGSTATSTGGKYLQPELNRNPVGWKSYTLKRANFNTHLILESAIKITHACKLKLKNEELNSLISLSVLHLTAFTIWQTETLVLKQNSEEHKPLNMDCF